MVQIGHFNCYCCFTGLTDPLIYRFDIINENAHVQTTHGQENGINERMVQCANQMGWIYDNLMKDCQVREDRYTWSDCRTGGQEFKP